MAGSSPSLVRGLLRFGLRGRAGESRGDAEIPRSWSGLLVQKSTLMPQMPHRLWAQTTTPLQPSLQARPVRLTGPSSVRSFSSSRTEALVFSAVQNERSSTRLTASPERLLRPGSLRVPRSSGRRARSGFEKIYPLRRPRAGSVPLQPPSPLSRPYIREQLLPASDFSLSYVQLSCHPRLVASRSTGAGNVQLAVKLRLLRELSQSPIFGSRGSDHGCPFSTRTGGTLEGFPRSHQRKQTARYFLLATSSNIAVVKDFGRSIA